MIEGPHLPGGDGACAAGADALTDDVAEASFAGLRVVGARLDRGVFSDCLFVDCDLSAIELRDASLRRIEFRDCRLSGANFAGAALHDVRFAECKLDDANFRMARADGIVFEDTMLVEADFYAASLPKAEFRRCDLTGAEFSKVAMPGADLRTSRIDGLKGAMDLSSVTIDSTQMIPFALSLFAALGVTIDDDPPE
ncbi:MAG: pentapeptide repeat-containing protein [Actinobacteria bacterium]|nr:pentapeptide repeat-containing protein [Actinomycetota bacterium]